MNAHGCVLSKSSKPRVTVKVIAILFRMGRAVCPVEQEEVWKFAMPDGCKDRTLRFVGLTLLSLVVVAIRSVVTALFAP